MSSKRMSLKNLKRSKQLFSDMVPVVTDKTVGAVPRHNLILLGNVNTNRVVFRLYGNNYTPADDLYSGRGGYLVQTIHDPRGMDRIQWGCSA